jgi:hypothetical protein
MKPSTVAAAIGAVTALAAGLSFYAAEVAQAQNAPTASSPQECQPGGPDRTICLVRFKDGTRCVTHNYTSNMPAPTTLLCSFTDD